MSFARVVWTAGLTGLALGVIARSWSWARYGPSTTTPPCDCPPRGAKIVGLEVVRRAIGSTRTAPVLVLVHDRASTGERMLEAVRELRGPAIVLAPTAPMPVGEGAAWLWPELDDDSFAAALESAARWFTAFAREVRRCHPGRRLVLMGHGQGAHLSLAAASHDPTIADELIMVGGVLPSPWATAALPATVMLHSAQAPELERARASAASWRARGLPVRWVEVDGPGEPTGALQARLLAELERAAAGRTFA